MTWRAHRHRTSTVGHVPGRPAPRAGSWRRTWPRLVAAASAAGLLGVAVAGAPAAAQDAEGEASRVEADEAVASDRAVVGDGHVDIGPRFLDGEWTLLVRDDTVVPSVWRHLIDVVLQATDAAVVEVPDDPQFAFLGEPGAEVWVLPQVQQQGILWPGWNTQDPEVATRLERQVTWTLHEVEGPGAVVLFVNQDFGAPETLFDSREPYPQDTGIELNTHAHANWVFTAPGVYRLAMEMSGTTQDGEQVRGGGTLRVAVGDTTNPDDAFAAPDLALPSGEADGAGGGSQTGGDTRGDDAAGGADAEAGGDTGAGDAAGGADAASEARADEAADGDSGSTALAVVVGAVVVLVAGALALLAARSRVRRSGSSGADQPGDAGTGRDGAAGPFNARRQRDVGGSGAAAGEGGEAGEVGQAARPASEEA